MIEGKSPLGNLIQYTHSGNTTVPANANRVVLDPLLPQTNYLFRVAVLTTRGEGMQVQTRGSTDTGVSDFGKNVLQSQAVRSTGIKGSTSYLECDKPPKKLLIFL